MRAMSLATNVESHKRVECGDSEQVLWAEAVGPESEHCGLLSLLSSMPLSSLSPPVHFFSACV